MADSPHHASGAGGWSGSQWPQTREAHYSEYGGHGGGEEYWGSGELPLAPIHRRAGARLMDNALVAVFSFAVVVPIAYGALGVGQSANKTKTDGGVWNWPILWVLFVVLAVLPFIYEAVQLSMWGRTLGKRILHMSVLRADPPGSSMTMVQAVWRAAINNVGYQLGLFFFLAVTVMVWEYAAYGLILALIGTVMAYLWAIWDLPLHQAVHDRFAGTIVVDDRVEAGHGHH